MNKYLEKIAEIQDRDFEKQAMDPVSMYYGGLAAKELGHMVKKKFAKKVPGALHKPNRQITTQVEAGLRGGNEQVRRSFGDRLKSTLFTPKKERALVAGKDAGTKAREVGAGGKPWGSQNFAERRETAQALRQNLGNDYKTFKTDRKALVQERQQVAKTAPVPAQPPKQPQSLHSVQHNSVGKKQALAKSNQARFEPQSSKRVDKVIKGAASVADFATLSPMQAMERHGIDKKLAQKFKGGAKAIGAGVAGQAGYHVYHVAHDALHSPAAHEAFQSAARFFGG